MQLAREFEWDSSVIDIAVEFNYGWIRTRRTTPHVFYTFDALELKNKKKKNRKKAVLARNKTVNIAVIWSNTINSRENMGSAKMEKE